MRGFDIANITFIEGDTGVIALDAPDPARRPPPPRLRCTAQHRGNRTLHTVIYSHSHADHFGGVAGLVDEADDARRTRPGDCAIRLHAPRHCRERDRRRGNGAPARSSSLAIRWPRGRRRRWMRGWARPCRWDAPR
ncbi:MBL fold metallo-hydrolase [Cupriavidus basilensis]